MSKSSAGRSSGQGWVQRGLAVLATGATWAALLAATPAEAAFVNWSGLGLSDNAGGAFVSTATVTTTGASNETLDIALDGFNASNFSSLFLGDTLSFGVSADTGFGPLITGFDFEIIGSSDPTDPGSMASYVFNADPAVFFLGSASGSLDYSPDVMQSLVGVFQLFETGGFTSISDIRVTARLPEPGSLSLISLAFAGLAAGLRRRARLAAPLAMGLAVAGGAAHAATLRTAPDQLGDSASTSTSAPLRAKPLSMQTRSAKQYTQSALSPSGALAKRIRATIQKQLAATGRAKAFSFNPGDGTTVIEEDCDDCIVDPDFTFPGGGSNAEIRVAVDPTGQNIIIGFNDARGFSFSPTSLSGVAYSTNGGLSFNDGGRLPNGPTESVGGSLVPQIFGDPDVKWVPGGTGCNFVYSSIMVKRFPASGAATGTAQTMSLHRTTDCGLSWQGPFEVTAATNPNGGISGGSARDAADKEFIDVDTTTGRVLLSWTNFSTNSEIRTTYSDNIFGASPTWAPSSLISTSASGGYFGQGSMPRYAKNSSNAYVVWSQSSATLGTPYSGFSAGNIGFARSTDKGQTWSAGYNLRGADFYPIDYILGNDRVHSFPAIAVDNSGGSYDGNIYVVYAANGALSDGADVFVQRSTDKGLSFQAPVSLSPRPGSDRPQWFPTVAVDSQTGRVSVFYYDQSPAATGDLMQATWTYSDDGGVTWSSPTRVCAPPAGSDATGACDRAFRAGYGNDTSQPNLGDYIGNDALLGATHFAFAGTPKRVGFTDGQPSASMTTPEVRYKKLTTGSPSLDLGSISLTDSGGNGLIDAGDTVRMFVPLTNFVTNPATSPTTYTNVSGTLSSSTPGVTLLRSTVAYPNVAPGATATSGLDFVFQVSPGFVPGTPIDFKLAVTTAQGSSQMAFYKNTGTPVATTIFAENFDGAAGTALPAGWASSHGGGSNVVPWVTNTTFCGTGSKALFHANANDAANPTRFERAFSPLINVPSDSAYVSLEFDTCVDTEDASDFNVLAYDGFTLRVTDQTAGRTLRSVLAEAFAEEFTTGTANHMPKHLPRGSSSAYFQDMSVWAGGNGAGPSGFKPVKMRLPGMQGSRVQLRFEYTQDGGGTCNDVRPGAAARVCGVMVDNLVMKSYTLKSDELASVSLTPVAGQAGKYTGIVKAQPIAGAGGIAVNLSSSNPGITSMPASVVIPQGSQTSAPFAVTLSPASGVSVTITAAGPTNARSAGVRAP
jgi:hypothetical protein